MDSDKIELQNEILNGARYIIENEFPREADWLPFGTSISAYIVVSKNPKKFKLLCNKLCEG
jgi:hypothetical protein